MSLYGPLRRSHRVPVVVAAAIAAILAQAGCSAAYASGSTGHAAGGFTSLAQGMPAAASARPSDPFIGFVFERGRVVRTIDLPATGELTALTGINDRGQITGKFPDADAPGYHGLLLERSGRFRSIDYPGAQATYANKINDRGLIVGAANRTGPDVGTPGTVGYLLERGRFTKIAYPGAVYTQALGLNNRRQVVGEYVDGDGVIHGFRWERGRFTTFDGPRGAVGATITDINDRGDMVGSSILPGGSFRGFGLRAGRYTSFGAFGLPTVLATDINNRGQIAGFALSTAEPITVHGFFLASGAGGPVTQIDVPGAPRTQVIGLDDRGRLAGVYENPEAAPTVSPGDLDSPTGPGR